MKPKTVCLSLVLNMKHQLPVSRDTKSILFARPSYSLCIVLFWRSFSCYANHKVSSLGVPVMLIVHRFLVMQTARIILFLVSKKQLLLQYPSALLYVTFLSLLCSSYAGGFNKRRQRCKRFCNLYERMLKDEISIRLCSTMNHFQPTFNKSCADALFSGSTLRAKLRKSRKSADSLYSGLISGVPLVAMR
jgi:hypothetical protein